MVWDSAINNPSIQSGRRIVSHILLVDLGHPRNILPRIGRPLAPSILPGDPLLAVFLPVSLKVAVAACVLGAVPTPLIMYPLQSLPILCIECNSSSPGSCLPRSELLMFHNQSGWYLFNGQRLSVGDASSDWVVLHGRSVEQEEDLVIVLLGCAPSTEKLVEKLLQCRDKVWHILPLVLYVKQLTPEESDSLLVLPLVLLVQHIQPNCWITLSRVHLSVIGIKYSSKNATDLGGLCVPSPADSHPASYGWRQQSR